MSVNQVRAEKNNLVYRKSGSLRSNNSSGHHFRHVSGTGTGRPPPSCADLSFKKSNNAQGGQSRGNFGSVNAPSDPSFAVGVHSVDNGGHAQSTLHGAPAAIPETTDTSSTTSSPKAPSSHSSSMTPESALLSTPAKGDPGKGFPLQFGSLSPGFMNGTLVPSRISSAPPNLDEQKRKQGRNDTSRAASSAPVPPAPKLQDVACIEQPVTKETHTDPKVKRDLQVTSAPPLMQSQSQRPSVLPMAGMSVPMPFHQPTIPMQFGGPISQIQSQSVVTTSLQMPMQMPLQMGNASQVQQPVYLPSLQHHLMQPQGIMHQGHGLGFNPQLGHPLPHQLGNVGLSISPQFNQQQSGKFGSTRKIVKITHPETREELRLDKNDGGLPRSRSQHIRPQQTQPLPTYTSAHHIGYYSSSYPAGPVFPVPNSLPLANTQLTSSPQAPRFNYPISQALPTMPLTKHSSSSKGGPSAHGTSEFVRDVQNMLPSPSMSTPVTVKAAGDSPKQRGTDFNDGEKIESQKLLRTLLEPVVRKDLEVIADDWSLHSKSGSEHSKQPALGSVTAVTTSMNVVKKDTLIKSDSAKDVGKQPEKKGDFPLQDSGDSSKVAASGTAQAGTTHTPSGGGHAAPVSVEESAISTNAAASGTAEVDSGLENKVGMDSNAKQSYHLMQGVTKDTPVVKEREKETIGGLQSHSSLKPMDFIKKVEHDDDKKFVQKADLLEASQKEVGSVTSLPEGDKTVSQISPLACESTTFDGNKISNATTALSKRDSVSCKEYDASRSSMLNNGAAPFSPNLLEMNLGQDVEVIENTRPNPLSGSNKTSMEPGNTKNNKAKKKRKEMLQKADAQGTSSDLYMAYKGPEEKKEAFAAIEDTSDSNLKNLSVDAGPENSPRKKSFEKNKPEFEDWENAADISVTEESAGSYNADKGVTKRKYSRDFLLTFSEQYIDLPQGFEVTFDISDAFMHTNVSTTRGYREYPNVGRIVDRPSAAMRPDRRGNGVMDADRWAKLPGGHPLGRNPGLDLAYGGKVMGFRPVPGANFGVRVQGPVQHFGGILSEPMYSIGLQQRNKFDDRWQRATNFNRGFMPSFQTPLQAMHRAEIKYEVGKITDEEQAKQRRLKAILNKLTPQNFEKLFEQVKEVNIDNAVTLTGVISQIFDKALMEPTFCEMYANFCYHLASELPDLSVDNEKITFKRLLLNKCQEEFERGEREEEEANKVDGEGETEQSEVQREEKRLKARRRMLGNIRLIGELYKKRMLTERIMHECIKKLLGQYHNPDEENIEALCKLMSTIGEMIDHSKAKEHMDAYYDIMGQLSNNMKLSSRVRFMLKDAIDLRKNKWQQRRKVEGPKKIEEVRRDVAKERQGQAGRLGRGPSSSSAMRRGQPVDYVPRGSMLSVGQVGGFKGMTTQVRGYGGKDVRMDDRSILENRTLSVPLLQRSSGDESITLGPQGGLARGMSFRGQSSVSGAPSTDATSFYGDPRKMVGGSNGYSFVADHGAYSLREDGLRRLRSERSGVNTTAYDQSCSQLHSNYMNRVSDDLDKAMHRSMPTSSPMSQAGVSSAQSLSSEKVWPEERLRDMSIAAIKEYYSAKDEKEVALCIKDLNAPSFYPTVVSIWVTDAFERKDKERNMLAQLLVSLAKPRQGIFSQDQLIEGFESILTNLEDTVTDAPRAPEFLGQIFGKVISENVLSLKDVGRLIHEGGEEPGRLLEAGLAADVLGSVLEMIKLEKGESILNEIRSTSDLQLEDFRPPDPIRSKKLEMFIM